ITAAVVVGALGSYARIRPGIVGRWRVALSLLFAVSGLALAGISGRAIAVGYGCPQDYVDLHSPFRDGTWCVVSGGGGLLINTHNVPNQVYGMDIVKVNSLGRIVNGYWPYSNE